MISALCPTKAHRALQAGVLLALAVVGSSSLVAGIESERLLAAIRRETPSATPVGWGEEMRRAEAAAAAIPRAVAFTGVGASMAPLYAGRTAIVVVPMEFPQLRKGMTVVYRNGHGRLVAHALIGNLPQGWIAQGMNNELDDDDLVTPENLVGVIVQAFSASNPEVRVARAQRPANPI